MTSKPAHGDANRRQFFRASGVIFLRIVRVSADETSSVESSDRLNAIDIRLMHFRSKLLYEQPEAKPYLMELANMLDELHRALLTGGLDKLPTAEKKTVVISGSGLEFASAEEFIENENLLLEITFPEYPYTTIKVKARVVGLEKTDTDSKKVCVCYEEITENVQETIIKYVNQLQRDQRHPKKS